MEKGKVPHPAAARLQAPLAYAEWLAGFLKPLFDFQPLFAPKSFLDYF
jgi:hypothetical protein